LHFFTFALFCTKDTLGLERKETSTRQNKGIETKDTKEQNKKETKERKMKANIMRDKIRRVVASQLQPKREALRWIIQQKPLSLQTRIKAQLELQQLTRYSSLVGIEPRCIQRGRTRNIQVKWNPIEFRLLALNGELPGIKRSCW
jgi:small subunit ribosomal protein S14